MRICTVPGCNNKYRRNGYCEHHFGQVRHSGTYLCKYTDCDVPTVAGSFCAIHQPGIRDTFHCPKCNKYLTKEHFNEYRTQSLDGTFCKNCYTIYRIERNLNDPRLRLWRGAKNRAKRENVAFNIELDDIVIPIVCPLLNVPIVIGNKKTSDNSPSLDKIIPPFGYIRGNIGVISYKANRLKSCHTLRTILDISTYIVSSVDPNLLKQWMQSSTL